MTKKDKNWEDGWSNGYVHGFQEAIDKIVYILEHGDLREIYEKEYRK